MIAVLKRIWLPALMVVALAVGVLSVTHLRSVFGSDGAVVTPVGSDTAEKFNPKVVVYEVFGTGTTATINYTDLKGLPQRTEAPLPGPSGWRRPSRQSSPISSPRATAVRSAAASPSTARSKTRGRHKA